MLLKKRKLASPKVLVFVNVVSSSKCTNHAFSLYCFHKTETVLDGVIGALHGGDLVRPDLTLFKTLGASGVVGKKNKT